MKFLPVLLLVSAFAALASAENLVCYFTSWTVYRPGNGKFDVPDMDPNLCTHILYGFVGLSWDNKVQVLDSWEADDDGLKGISRLIALKEQNPNLKVLVSMGGWNEGSGKYSTMAADPAKRQVFVADVLRFVQERKFDGFDLDWEYPGQRDGSDPENDPKNYVSLLQELKAALGPEGLLLTAAVAGAGKSIDLSYDVPAVSGLLDIINVMAYDFHGAFEPFVGHYAPLSASSLDTTDEQKALNIHAGIEHWISKGADPKKLHLGLGTYGRSFTLADASNTSLYAPAVGEGGSAGPYTRQAGVLGYNEICELYSSWQYVWDEEQQVPHRVNGNQWVGYDDEKSITLKVQYAKSKGLGGVMVWSPDTDDFKAICGSRYPLITAASNALK